jgi:demethylmenaquinone methyltransferase/2-methoxy-6-polyprenyl-1,4-benzoquinol methylase
MSSVNDQTIPVYAGSIGSWKISVSRRPLGALELADRYDQIAAKWSRLTGRLGYPQAYERLWKQFIYKANLIPPAYPLRLLDCGVGTGSFALAFARAWDAPVCVDAVDVSDMMIEQARQRFRQEGYEVSIQCADVCALPYSDNQFDLVMAAHVLEHLPDPVAALKEMRRTLKPGGWLMLCLTRESTLGRYVQLKWRTHRLTPEQGETWLNAAGLNAERMNLASSGWFRQTSITCVGRKPAQPLKNLNHEQSR